MTGTEILKQIPIDLMVSVTDRDIEEGTGHACQSCPIAIATDRALDRIGSRFTSYVAPYGAWHDPRFELHNYSKSVPIQFPNILAEFAMEFDDWFDFHNDAEDYRLRNGYEEDEDCEPPKPSPFSFTIKVPRVVL